MFDMHSHIIPGIDDGAKDQETALSMLKIAAHNGTTHIAATPHVIEGQWLPEWENILEECKKLQKLVASMELSITVIPGAEVAMGMNILQRIKGPGAYCINGGRYMLVELPMTEIPAFADEFFFTLQARGITPILAHPERYIKLMSNPERLGDWIRRGILTQMNGTSLTGVMGERVREFAERLLLQDMIYMIGSDAHSKRTRNSNLLSAAEKVKQLLGNESARQLLLTNPQKILNNGEILLKDIKQYPTTKKKSRFRRLLTAIWR